MLITVPELQRWFRVEPTTILHVGAHLAEEDHAYRTAGWGAQSKIIWVESQQRLVEKLSKKLDPKLNQIIQAAVWHENDVELEFNISSNSQSSSLLKFGTHSQNYPEVEFIEKITVISKRLDYLIPDTHILDFINLDIQGAELSALRGLGNHLWNTRYIYSEVNKQQVYEGCPHIIDIDKFLQPYGFQRIATRWVFRQGWGDALWMRKAEIRGLRIPILKFKILTKVDWLRQLFMK